MVFKFFSGFHVSGIAVITILFEIFDFLFINEAASEFEDTGLITDSVTSTEDAGTIV